MYPESRSTTYVGETITPKDIKVFYEDGKPYVEYRGIVKLGNDTYEIEIPKMDMVLTALESVVEQYWSWDIASGIFAPSSISVKQNVHVHQDINFKLKPIKKRMTKADIEKKLGHKVEIVE